jgi:hypothetical protein
VTVSIEPSEVQVSELSPRQLAAALLDGAACGSWFEQAACTGPIPFAAPSYRLEPKEDGSWA